MKTKNFRMLLLASSFLAAMSATAQNSNDSIASDSSMWYNQTQQLGEVTIKSSLPKIRTNADGLKAIITGSELEKIGNSEDVLKRLPSVKNADEGVEIFGRGTAEVYVNGRKLYDMKELKQIPSDQIVNVEIITNPGARYAATTKAVVKIKTKRPQGEGWGFRDELKGYYRDGMSLRNNLETNYRNGGLDIGGWLWAEAYNKKNKTYESGEFYMGNQHVEQIIDKSVQEDHLRHFDIGFKANYMLNENSSFGMRYDFYRLPYAKHPTEFPSDFYIDGNLLQRFMSYMTIRTPQYKHNFNAYYSGKLGGWQLDANLDGVWTDSKSKTNTDETSTIPGQTDIKDHVLTTAFTKNRIYAGKIVLEHELWGGKISFGTEYDDTKRTELTANPKASDGDTKVNERIWAGFAEYKRTFFEKLNVNAGLRYEHVNSDYYNFGTKEMDKNYSDWFPSIGLAIPVGKVQMGAHYGIDIARPSFENLSDNVYYINSYTYQTGNSKLNPTYTHNISLNASWKWLWAEVSYNRIVDDIQLETTSYGKDDPLISLLHPANLAPFHRYTFQVFASPTLFDIWHPTWGFVINGQDYEATSADGSKVKMNKPMIVAMWNNLVILKNGWRFGLDLNYQGKGDYSTYHLEKSALKIDACIQKSSFKDKLDAKFAINDITGVSAQPVTVYSYRNLYVRNSNPVYVDLTLTYKFNLAADKYKGAGAGDKQKSRIK